MATRGYIAKIERDGSGRYIYLGHRSHPAHSGQTLLEHYQHPDKMNALLDLGAIPYVQPDLADIMTYCQDNHLDWRNCAPTRFTGGTDAYFLQPWMPGPEWLYAWTPDGWLAAPVEQDVPHNFYPHVLRLSPERLQEWFDHNQEPQWIAWRQRCREYQQPRPLERLVRELAASAPPIYEWPQGHAR